MIDVVLLIIVAVVTYCVAGEGAWGAAITAMSVVLAGLIAMNFYEPICENLMGGDEYWQRRMDLVVLVGLFVGALTGLRAGADHLSPTYIGVHRMVHEGVRWFSGLMAGYVTMAFLLTALHTAALPREFMGFRAERANFFATAPDRQWLGFVQYVTERVCVSSPARPFDGPQIKLGDATDPNRNKTNNWPPEDIWPSFPIRYATRRERGSAPPAPQPVRPAQPQQPSAAPGF